MKVAIIGTGNTGKEVISLLKKDEISGIYNTKNPVTIDQLKKSDGAIVFIPGSAFLEILPLLISSGKPVICGSTGLQLPTDIDDELKKRKLTWVHANNFSLGMNLVKEMIEVLSNAEKILPEPKFTLKEVHHQNKKDTPSGTALNWQRWLKKDIEIESVRTGDVVGTHELNVKTPYETITLRHESQSRSLFASGAIWTLKRLVEDNDFGFGLLKFEDIVRNKFKI